MDIEILYRLQEMEIKEGQARRNLRNLPQLKELKGLKEIFEVRKKGLNEKKVQLNEAAQDGNTMEKRQALIEKQRDEISGLLYSGAVSSPKELENLERQAEALKQQASLLTEEILVQMEQKEKLESEVQELTQELEDRYREFQELKDQYQRTKINREQQLRAMEEDKTEILSQIDKLSLDWYDQKKKTFAGTPIAQIMENHACGGCRTLIPITIVKQARAKRMEVFCENCGRLLYAPSIY
jgi:predicted  nucleic acid-binding Zn-ribbon protein